mgnify:CR=1 FL=1
MNSLSKPNSLRQHHGRKVSSSDALHLTFVTTRWQVAGGGCRCHCRSGTRRAKTAAILSALQTTMDPHQRCAFMDLDNSKKNQPTSQRPTEAAIYCFSALLNRQKRLICFIETAPVVYLQPITYAFPAKEPTLAQTRRFSTGPISDRRFDRSKASKDQSWIRCSKQLG